MAIRILSITSDDRLSLPSLKDMSGYVGDMLLLIDNGSDYCQTLVKANSYHVQS